MSKNLALHCRVINFRDNNLIIAADSAAWATRLKFAQNDLLSDLRAEGMHGLRSIKVIVANQSHTTDDHSPV
ncbi:MAG: DUF721 domain-containing protein [Gammaproteobacteria bacterium]|nr:DUF721 domain-containing protein [Gammaproteobacteria bacterium]NVK86509.1 DUF721 domain-containing protein [Gammaproteobacteria bacterium]